MRSRRHLAAALLASALALPNVATKTTRMRVSWCDAPGQRTASSARFDPRALTAASRTLPLGTRLTLRNPRTGKRVVDRGPWVRGRSLYVTPAVVALSFRRAGHAVLEVAQAPANEARVHHRSAQVSWRQGGRPSQRTG
jgi:rare lipoprotein A